MCIYCDDCVYHYKSTELISLYALDIGLINSARNLGVIFDKCIKLDYHISSVCKSTYFHLRNIGGIRNIRSNDACAQLFTL